MTPSQRAMVKWFLYIIVADEPTFSLRRVMRGIRMWFYLTVANELDMPVGLWHFIKYQGRPCAQERDGYY